MKVSMDLWLVGGLGRLEADMGLVQGPLPESFRRMKLKEEQQESQGM